MKEIIKNRKAVIAAGIVILVVIIAAVFFLTSNKTSQTKNTQGQNAIPTQAPVLTLTPNDIGLSLTEATDMQTATMTITKTSDISSIDYQLSYNAMVSGQSIPRGTIGHVDVKTQGQTITQQMVFGTCSDVCHYDTGITDVQLIVKVTKTDSTIYQVQITPTPSPSQ